MEFKITFKAKNEVKKELVKDIYSGLKFIQSEQHKLPISQVCGMPYLVTFFGIVDTQGETIFVNNDLEVQSQAKIEKIEQIMSGCGATVKIEQLN